MSVVRNIKPFLDLGKYTGGEFVDLGKSLDTVDQDVLLKKYSTMVIGEYQIDGSGNTLIREQNLFQLKTIHLGPDKFWPVYLKVQS